jgi:RNA polymerase sigma factor (sigma-70 family)
MVVMNNGTIDDARDIFQEAIIVLYEKTKSPGFELNCQIGTFLYAVSRRLWLKKLQQQQFSGDIEMASEHISVEEDLELLEQKNQEFMLMEKSLQSIGEPCKSLLEAYYIQKKNMVDIAQYFGYTSADNAKNQKYKCLMRLKKLFFAQYKNQ